MVKATFTFLLIFFSLDLFPQSYSGFDLNSSATHSVYLENRDKLFLASLGDNKSTLFIDDDLSNSENEILRSWNKSGDQYIYEKGGDFYIYSLKTQDKQRIDLSSDFQLFRYYRINQVAATDDAFYFSAKNRATDEYFSLYKLDLDLLKVNKIVEVKGDVSNITISANDQNLVFTSYIYSDDKYQNQIHLMDVETERVLVSSEIQHNSFFSNLSFSQNGHVSLRNMDGSASIAEFNPSNSSVQISKLDLPLGHYLIGFFENQIVTVSLGETSKNYTLFNQELDKIHDLRGNSNLTMIDYSNGSFYIIKEDGKTPKALYKYDLATQIDQPILVLSENNPLANNKFEILSYTEGNGKSRNGYLYYPDQQVSGNFPTILMTYGGYSDAYPNMGYFLNRLIFPLLEEGFGILLLNTRGVNSERLGEGYGEYQLEDTHQFIDQMKGKVTIDFDQLIPVGHSHGATMVNYYLTHSDRFLAGIAINGAADWVAQAKLKSMTGLPGEMGGDPNEIPEVYQNRSPLENLTEKTPPILLISGGKDGQIPAQINSFAMEEKANQVGAKVEHMHFESAGHLIDGDNEMKLVQKKIDQFLKNLLHN